MNNLKYVSLFAGMILFFGANVVLAATDDYVNYYPFDEGMGRTVADTKGGQNGVLTGTSTKFGWASGQVGTALGMDGVDGESVALPDGFLSGSQGSLAVWFKVNSLTDRNIIFSGRSTSDNYIYFALMVDYQGRPELMFRTTRDGNDQKAQGSQILNVNEWYQLVFTADGQSYHMFINGEEATVAGATLGRWFSDLTNQTFKYRIGTLDANPLSGVLDGYLDDLRIYNRVLTLADVVELYHGGSPGKPGNPVVAQTPQPQSVSVTLTTTTAATTSVSSSPTATAQATLTSTPAAPQALISVNTAAERKALIDSLIKQILLLIAELQKQLAVLKGQGTY